MGNFIWGRVYGLGKIGRGKVYDSLQEYSPLGVCPIHWDLCDIMTKRTIFSDQAGFELKECALDRSTYPAWTKAM